jgi:hypothetical protein
VRLAAGFTLDAISVLCASSLPLLPISPPCPYTQVAISTCDGCPSLVRMWSTWESTVDSSVHLAVSLHMFAGTVVEAQAGDTTRWRAEAELALSPLRASQAFNR